MAYKKEREVLAEDTLICLNCGKEFYSDIGSESYILKLCPKCYEDYEKLEDAELQDLKDSEEN